MKAWGLSRVTGDAYAGQTFRRDFEDAGISYVVSGKSASDLHDAFEPKLNEGEVELLDHPKLTEQLLTLVMKGGKITHISGDHDDFANAAAGAIVMAGGDAEPGFLGHYRLMTESANAAPDPAPASRQQLDGETIALRCPQGTGAVGGWSGRTYYPDARA